MEHNTITEMKEILDAIEQGKEVQYQEEGTTNEWVKYTGKTPNFFSFRYRIKPEEPKKKWRPFAGTADVADAAYLHGTWVINTNNHQHCQIVAFDKGGALIAQATKTYEELLHNFVFADGTPCGVEE